MPSRTISVEEGAYRRLKAAKREGESFSEVIERLLRPHDPSLLDFRGLLSAEAAEDLRRTIQEMRQHDVVASERRFRRSEG